MTDLQNPEIVPEFTAEQLLIQEIQQTIRALLDVVSRPTVVELGAFHAEDSAWMSPHAGRYVAVEPDPRNAASIRRHGLNGITTLLEVAIASHSGQTPFYLCDNSIGRETASSSIREPKEHLKYFPWCSFRPPIMMPCLSLSDLYHLQNIGRVELLWADLQGAERDMIEGGAAALLQTHYLFMEADSDEMYRGQAARAELLAMLPTWETVREFDYNLLLRNTVWPPR